MSPEFEWLRQLVTSKDDMIYTVAIVMSVIIGILKVRKEYLDDGYRKLKDHSDWLKSELDSCEKLCRTKTDQVMELQSDIELRDKVGKKLAKKYNEEWDHLIAEGK